jgi:hypothetical protein
MVAVARVIYFLWAGFSKVPDVLLKPTYRGYINFSPYSRKIVYLYIK